jgi:hypothetical protein
MSVLGAVWTSSVYGEAVKDGCRRAAVKQVTKVDIVN